MLPIVLAQSGLSSSSIPWPLVAAVVVAVVIFGMTSGGNAAPCVHGGAAFVVPLLQDYAYLSLEPIQIEVPLKGALSIENIRVNVPSVFTVAIGTDAETMQNAAIRLLELDTQEIKEQARDII